MSFNDIYKGKDKVGGCLYGFEDKEEQRGSRMRARASSEEPKSNLIGSISGSHAVVEGWLIGG